MLVHSVVLVMKMICEEFVSWYTNSWKFEVESGGIHLLMRPTGLEGKRRIPTAVVVRRVGALIRAGFPLAFWNSFSSIVSSLAYTIV